MALTTRELNTVDWKWNALGDEWGFDPRRTSLPHPAEKAARDSLSTSEIDAIVLAQKWKVIRKKRNDLLIASDWTQGADVPSPIKYPWTRYRGLLRDITLQPDPDNISWPTKP
tara:strand:- start:76 stop:414 length:339 start_codon:yes stop_codon:yes gene_type:complete